jgi:hypothetical protein
MLPYNLTGLSPNTSYQFRVVATNANGTTTGAWVTFTTLGGGGTTLKPTVVTTTDVPSTTSAILNGSVNPNGATTTAWFETSTSGHLQTQVLGSGTSTVTMLPYNLTGLSPNTSYQFRVVATNANGTTTGNWIPFTTLGNTNNAPTLISVSPTSGAQGQNNISVALTGNGFIAGSVVTFSGTGITINSTTINSATSITTVISIDLNAITGQRDVTVTNANGTSNPSTFKVLGYTNITPTLTSLSPASGTQGQSVSVVLTGTGFTGSTVSFSGNGISLNNTTINSDTSMTADISIGTGATIGGSNVTVTNGFGTSNAETFTVFSASNGGGGGGGGGYLYPVVNTEPATNVAVSSATLNGTIGNANIYTTDWFQYGTSSNLAGATETLHSSASIYFSYLPITESVSGLLPNTTYYFRAVTNSLNSGTIYGNILSFTTLGNGNIIIANQSNNKEYGVNTVYADQNPTTTVTTQSQIVPTPENNNFSNQIDKNLGAAGIFGYNFLPSTLFGWIIFILVVLILLVLFRNLYLDYTRKHTAKEKSADHIENLPV